MTFDKIHSVTLYSASKSSHVPQAYIIRYRIKFHIHGVYHKVRVRCTETVNVELNSVDVELK